MADQDSPLDLTVKRAEEEPRLQDGVLDLSTKKNRNMAAAGLRKSAHSFTSSPTLKGSNQRSLRADRAYLDEDISSAPVKPPLARSLLIKEELLSQKHRLLGQPAALSLASLESAGLLDHGGPVHPLLGREGSSPWGGKAHHLDSLLKLKQASGALSGALGDLKDLPLFLDNHHHHGAFSSKSPGSLLPHHHHHHHHPHHHPHAKPHHGAPGAGEAKREQGPHGSLPVDLKIPQVRGMDLSWDSAASDVYGYGGGVAGGAGHGGESALSRKLRAILPKQGRRGGGGVGGLLDGAAADYWGSDVDQSAAGPPYPTSDPEGDPGSKQPRKKRGRYRQYNSEILEEAIAVVMGGKMSVSKAQNIYGIPHSTLEYKVKERLGTLKNPPKKKLKLTTRTGEGHDSAPESEATPTATPRDDGPPAGELKDQ